ncbi:hypothetical protein SESBI_14272 [Sesbania bispinosa]|nr:hypothetical protein SESBI_14272 [Sesbania bispinosa]
MPDISPKKSISCSFSYPLFTSYTCTKSAGSAIAIYWPSEVYRIDRMAPRLPFSTATDLDKFRKSQIRQVLSWFPVAKVTPSGCHDDANEKSKCPDRESIVCKMKKFRLAKLSIISS